MRIENYTSFAFARALLLEYRQECAFYPILSFRGGRPATDEESAFCGEQQKKQIPRCALHHVLRGSTRNDSKGGLSSPWVGRRSV